MTKLEFTNINPDGAVMSLGDIYYLQSFVSPMKQKDADI